MNPEITAIIPTHNRVHLLAATLRTVLWQRDVALEAIVVDDGSSEDVTRELAGFGDARLRVIRHDTPQGVSAARNHGAAEARGEWLAFCDDDDLWAPDKLTCLLSAARDANSTWSYGGAVHVNIASRVLSGQPPPSPDRLVATLPRWNLVPGGSSNVIVRADTFRAAGRWDTALINLADWDLWARLAQQGPPSCVARPLVGYRIHAGNASGDTGLILREARHIDGRYGSRIDYGELHYYLAWVYLRGGRRRAAVPHLVQAAARGQMPAVARTLVGLANRRAARWLPTLWPAPVTAHADWVAEAETWVAPLRKAPHEFIECR